MLARLAGPLFTAPNTPHAILKENLKVGFVSLGCPKNLVDSEVMMGQLVASGHELTPHPDQADVLVVNTCSFIDPAKKESVDTILEMAEYKKIGRAQKLIVAGCLVERYRGDIRKEMPEVDALIGTNELDSIVAVCEGMEPGRRPARAVPLSRPDAARARHAAPLRLHQDRRRLRSSLHLLRDSAVSRRVPQPPLRIRDRRSHAPVPAGRPRDQPDRPGHHLLRRGLRPQGRPGALCSRAWRRSKRRSEKWIRFLYAYPNKVTQKLLDTIAEHPSLVKYIDMPLQHASADVLKRMKRGASGDIFLKLIERIRRTIPGVAIRTSFIVGFPGETAEDFEELCQFVEAAQVRQPRRVHLLRRRHQRELPAGRQGGRPHHPESQAPPDGDPAQDLARAQSRSWSAGSSGAGRRASRRRPTCCGKAACPPRRRRSTASR